MYVLCCASKVWLSASSIKISDRLSNTLGAPTLTPLQRVAPPGPLHGLDSCADTTLNKLQTINIRHVALTHIGTILPKRDSLSQWTTDNSAPFSTLMLCHPACPSVRVAILSLHILIRQYQTVFTAGIHLKSSARKGLVAQYSKTVRLGASAAGDYR